MFILPFTLPPKEPFKWKGVTVRESGFSDKNAEIFHTRMFGHEIFKLFGREPGEIDKARFTLIESGNADLRAESIAGVADLVFGHWKYELAVRVADIAMKQAGVDILDRISGKGFPKVNQYRWTESRQTKFKAGLNLLLKRKKAQIAFERWRRSYGRESTVDALLDLCTALEAVFSMSDELRLRLSLATYHTRKKGKKKGFTSTYMMYGERSKYIHGDSLPEIDESTRHEYVENVASVLDACVDNSDLPDGNKLSNIILNQFSSP